MSVHELKEKLIARIREEDDERLLASVYDWLQEEGAVREPGVVYLTEAQKQGLEEALEDVKEGRVHSHEEVMSEMEAWLRKRAAKR